MLLASVFCRAKKRRQLFRRHSLKALESWTSPYFHEFALGLSIRLAFGILASLFIARTSYMYIHLKWQLPILSLARLSSSTFSVHSPRETISRRSDARGLRCGIVAVHEELRKDSKVQDKRARTSDQPAQVDQNVLAVDVRSLARLAVAALVPVAVGVFATDWLEGEDAEDESQVSEAGEEEE
jgi:hypothetical protein